MQAYKLKDLFIVIGEVSVYEAIIQIVVAFILVVIFVRVSNKVQETYEEFNEYRKFKRNMNKFFDSLNNKKGEHKCKGHSITEMTMEEIEEEINKRNKDEDKPEPKPEVKPEPKPEVKPDIRFTKQSLKTEEYNPSEEELEISKADAIERKQTQLNVEEIEAINKKASNASRDRIHYPKVFKEMEDLKLKLHEYYGVMQIARMLGVTGASLNGITTKSITTVKTAKKYIKGFKKILAEVEAMEVKPTPPINSAFCRPATRDKMKSNEVNEMSVNKITRNFKDKITPLETHELNRLIDTLLANMTQGELAIRIGMSQPHISDISRRKTKKSSMAKVYIKKLQAVERMVLGGALTNNGL